jgi:quinol monooxygenase YgiN
MRRIRGRAAPHKSILAGALGLGLMASASGAHAQAIYSVTSLELAAPSEAAQGVALLKQYRDAARKAPGNMGADVLQEMGRPNQFVVYETWTDQAAFDANDKAAPSNELRDKVKALPEAPYFDRRSYRGISVAPPKSPTGPGAVYLQVHLDVLPRGVEQTDAAAKVLAEAARKGEGNLRYDVVQSTRNPGNHHTIFAAWQSQKDFDDYEAIRPAIKFRDVIGPMLGSPYDDRLYTLVD